MPVICHIRGMDINLRIPACFGNGVLTPSHTLGCSCTPSICGCTPLIVAGQTLITVRVTKVLVYLLTFVNHSECTNAPTCLQHIYKSHIQIYTVLYIYREDQRGISISFENTHIYIYIYTYVLECKT